MASESEKKNTQLFDVCGVQIFTYKQLKTDMEKCINKIKKLTKSKKNGKDMMFVAVSYTEAEYEELRGYMKQFMADVDKDFDTKKGKAGRIASKIWHKASMDAIKNIK
jgi:hypothetical protein